MTALLGTDGEPTHLRQHEGFQIGTREPNTPTSLQGFPTIVAAPSFRRTGQVDGKRLPTPAQRTMRLGAVATVST